MGVRYHVRAKVGKGPAVNDVPQVTITRPQLEQDPVSGVALRPGTEDDPGSEPWTRRRPV